MKSESYKVSLALAQMEHSKGFIGMWRGGDCFGGTAKPKYNWVKSVLCYERSEPSEV